MVEDSLLAPVARPVCATCSPARPSFVARYRSFLLSSSTLITIANALLLASGALAALVLGAPHAANALWIAAILIAGAPILWGAIQGILRRDLTSDVMAAAAIVGALIIGEYSAGALVVFMLTFGEMLEDFTVARADNALQQLARLIPARVTLMRDGAQKTIATEDVQVGDIVLVRNGERLPVDGVVLRGHAAVDESTLSGEATPVDKAAGDTVFAGAMNTAGTLEIRAEKLGRDTTLGAIVKLVEEAQKSQAPVQRLADRYAQYLVPVVFVFAGLVFFLTGDPGRAVTILVVVCPCALILATPTALTAAIGNAARNHAVVKSGAAMEALGKVDVVAFDKTGTLTLGRPSVAAVVELDSVSCAEILAHAAGAEATSEHPLGKAIVQEAARRGLAMPPMDTVDVLTGFGVRALSARGEVLVGNRSLLAKAGVALTPAQDAMLAELEAVGHTVAPVAINGRPAGLIALSDALRPEAAGLVQALKAGGVKKAVLISGDSQAAVRSVAATLGVDDYHAGVLPGQKLEIIKELQGQGLRVAYVGDGVNDAPALAAADVGIAMGATGTDIAVETAKIALMRNNMQDLPHLLALSRESLRTIRVNVAFSMSVNLLAVALSAFAVIGPAFGAVMHELAALPVLAYAARLVSYRWRSR